MKVPKFVQREVSNVFTLKGKRSIQYACNFSDKAWPYILQLTDEDLFLIHPPAEINRGNGQFESKCLNCGNSTAFKGYTTGYRQFCSNKSCQLKYQWSTNYEANAKSRIEGMQKTMVKKYGTHACMLNKSLKEKQLQNSRFFTQSKDNAVKARATSLERYGSKGKSEETISRAKASLQKTRLENPELYATSTYQRKEVRIKRRKFSVQGYEGEALSWLANNGLDISSVKVNSVSVKYKDTGNQERVYISDFEGMFKRKRTVFEVKSDYTAGLLKSGKTMFYTLKRKAKAMKEQGYRFVVIIMDSKHVGSLITDFESKTLTEVRRLVHKEGFAFT